MKTQKEAFAAVAERDNLGGYWKCADCPRELRTLRAHNFAHIKPKGKYPEFKCDPDMILIKCYMCHSNNDHHQNVKNAEWMDN